MTDDLILKADAFRLSIDPTPDDVNEANWMIDRMTTTIEQQAARIAELEAVLGPLLTSAKMLQQNAEGCAVNHYGADFCTHGMPGWLLDTQQTIEDAAALKLEEGTDDT